MTAWTAEELERIGRTEEVDVAGARPDGSLRKKVTIWVVRSGDALYVRSVRGRDGSWFRGVQEKNEGRIWASGIEKDVVFTEVDHSLDDEIDAAYRSKYRRYAGRILNSCLTPDARSTTLKLTPR